MCTYTNSLKPWDPTFEFPAQNYQARACKCFVLFIYFFFNLVSNEEAQVLTLIQSKTSAAHLVEKQERQTGWQSLGEKTDPAAAPFKNKPIRLNSRFTISTPPGKNTGNSPCWLMPCLFQSRVTSSLTDRMIMASEKVNQRQAEASTAWLTFGACDKLLSVNVN